MRKPRTKIYARVLFTEPELVLTRGSMRDCLETARANVENATVDDERAFYLNVVAWAEDHLSKFSEAKPGRIGLSEDDLARVRGNLLSVLRPRLVKEWMAARAGGAGDETALSADIDVLSALEVKLDRPLVADTSQDAEPDEDDTEPDVGPVPAR